jgi:3-dehydroquinate synthase
MARVLSLMVDGHWFDMFEIEIFSSLKNYKILFSKGLSGLTNQDFFYIVDNAIVDIPFITQLDSSRMIFVDGSEKTKTIEFCSELISDLASRGVTRKSSLVAIGGGSVQDAVTLTASLYMRGIPWYLIPTTFMAMADSCVGGKSAINVGNYKNLAGNFYPPNEIRIEQDFLQTLPQSAIAAGLSEAAKIQIAKGQSHFNEFKSIYSDYRSTSNPSFLLEIVRTTLPSKKWFIEIDEFDKKERQLLNYGHSFGHALESASGMAIPHGLAIGVGMLVANSLVPTSPYLEDINQVLSEILRESCFDFGSVDINLDRFKGALRMDKKNSKNQQVLILLDFDSQLEVLKFDLNESRLDEQKDILKKVLKELGKVS